MKKYCTVIRVIVHSQVGQAVKFNLLLETQHFRVHWPNYWLLFITCLLSPPPLKGRGVRVIHLITCKGKKGCHILNLLSAKSQTTLDTNIRGAPKGAVSNGSLKIIFIAEPARICSA